MAGRGDDGSLAFYKGDSSVGFEGKGGSVKARVRVGSSSDSSSSAPHVQDKVPLSSAAHAALLIRSMQMRMRKLHAELEDLDRWSSRRTPLAQHTHTHSCCPHLCWLCLITPSSSDNSVCAR
jgi:hypothetical protein